MKIVLATMPWASLDCTSISLGTLAGALRSAARPHDVAEWYGNIEWAEWLLEVSDGQVTPADYEKFAGSAYFEGVGDWIFTSALYRRGSWKEAEYGDYLTAKGYSADLPVYCHHQADAFTEAQADKIVALRPALVGFTTTFLQNVSTLALAQRLREGLPGTAIVLGGGNCDGVQGEALLRNFPCLDYVVSGAGEEALVGLVDYLAGDRPDLVDVPNLLVRSGGGTVRRSLAKPSKAFPAGAVTPRFDGYFERLDASPVSEWVEPKLVIEGARGCWWGEKHQCTFCGLNGSTIGFSSQRADALWQQMESLVAAHQVLDIIMVDNIIDMGYYKSLLPLMAKSGYDLRVHYEIKSNISSVHARALRDANVVHVQPGIESLSNRVLALMEKGVSGVQNVACLRECERFGLTVSWNYLYGFPDEEDADYDTVVDQFPALVHLQPPGGITRIALERFSPFFERPELGFLTRRPADVYRFIYDLPQEELVDLVYLFSTPDRGITGRAEERLQAAAAEWVAKYEGGALRQLRQQGETVILDERPDFAERELVLQGTAHLVHALLDRGRTIGGIEAGLRGMGHRADTTEVVEIVEELRAAGLLFTDGGQYVALAVLPAGPSDDERLTA
ncbi:MAG: RiPP maturation radical SAM C-methyltransferase [Frankiaceae bacterium]